MIVAEENKSKDSGAGGVMEGIYFLLIWIGSALLHTLYELKVKPYLDTFSRNSGNWPFY